jgi:ribosomal protein S27E
VPRFWNRALRYKRVKCPICGKRALEEVAVPPDRPEQFLGVTCKTKGCPNNT